MILACILASRQFTKCNDIMRVVSKSHRIQFFTSTDQKSQCVNTFLWWILYFGNRSQQGCSFSNLAE